MDDKFNIFTWAEDLGIRSELMYNGYVIYHISEDEKGMVSLSDFLRLVADKNEEKYGKK